jgi:hypothetical protein
MPRKNKPIWQELGLTPVKSASGARKGFTDKQGNYIPERQFRKMVGTPIKGSQGYKERKAAKEAGKAFRPITQEKIWEEMKEAAKVPGMTLEQFMTGKAHEVAYSERRTQEAHNRYVDKQRKDALEFKRMSGSLTDKQFEIARKDLERNIKARNKILDIKDKLNNPKLSKEKRSQLHKQYREQVKKFKTSQSKLEKKGLVIMDDRPSEESLRYGYYHG